MMTNSNPKKQAWLLMSHDTYAGVIHDEPEEVFDTKETCFKKYPGMWNEVDNNVYHLSFCSQFEKYESSSHLSLIPLPLTKKSDVSE